MKRIVSNKLLQKVLRLGDNFEWKDLNGVYQHEIEKAILEGDYKREEELRSIKHAVEWRSYNRCTVCDKPLNSTVLTKCLLHRDMKEPEIEIGELENNIPIPPDIRRVTDTGGCLLKLATASQGSSIRVWSYCKQALQRMADKYGIKVIIRKIHPTVKKVGSKQILFRVWKA